MKLRILDQSIKCESKYSYLISIPHTDKNFWLSKKCCYPRLNLGYNIYLNENYTYTTSRKDTWGKGKIDGSDLIEYFSDYNVRDRTRPDVVVEEHVPQDVPAVDKVHVDSSLLRGENND